MPFDPNKPYTVISVPQVTRGSTFGWQQGPRSDPEDTGGFAYGGSSTYNPEDYAALPVGSGVPPGYKFPVINPVTGQTVWVTHRDKGPAKWTGRGVDLAPSAMEKLGAQTDDPLLIDTAKAVPPFDPSKPYRVITKGPETGGPGRPETEAEVPLKSEKEAFPKPQPLRNPDPYRVEVADILKRQWANPPPEGSPEYKALLDFSLRAPHEAELPEYNPSLLDQAQKAAERASPANLRYLDYITQKGVRRALNLPVERPPTLEEAQATFGEAITQPTGPYGNIPTVSTEGVRKVLSSLGTIGAVSPEGLEESPTSAAINEVIAKNVSGLTTPNFAATLPAYELRAVRAAAALQAGQGALESAAEGGPVGYTQAAFSGAIAAALGKSALPTPRIRARLGGKAEVIQPPLVGEEAAPRRIEGTEGTARFEGLAEEPTTAELTREALDRRQELVNEAQRLGEQQRLMRKAGQPAAAALLQDRINEINAELRAGPKAPKIEPRREVGAPTEEEFFGPEEPTPEEVKPSATEERIEPESYQPEYTRNAPRGAPPETSRRRGAEPGAPVQAEEAVTGISKAAIAKERAARGLPDIERQKQIDFPTSLERANQIVADDPTAPKRLVDELALKTRALNPEDTPLIIRRVQETKAEFDSATDAVNRATTDEARAAQGERLDLARAEYDKSVEAAQWATSRTGAGLNSLKMLVKDDYSLANMERQARAVINEGKPFDPKDPKQAKALFDVRALHKRLQKAESRIAEIDARDKFNALLDEGRREARRATKAAKAAGPGWLEQQEAKAYERIKARRGRLHAGYDPTAIFDEAIIGAAHLKRGITEFGAWSARMVKDVGEHIKPYIQDLWARAQELHRASKGIGRAGPISTSEKIARQIEGDIKRIKKGTAEYERRTREKDISPMRPPRQPRVSAEKTAALFEREEAKKAYHEMLVEARLKQQSFTEKSKRYIGETQRLARALKTSFDVSAVFRQGGFNFFAHPIDAVRAMGPMFKAMGSEAGQFKVMQEIRSRENYQSGLYKLAELFISEEGSPTLSKMEEVYASRWARKIPGVGASERAYTTYLNRIRADRFDAMASTLGRIKSIFGKGRELTPQEAKAIGNFVNVTTGRGYTPAKMAGATEFLNGIFFAPRFVLSRFQTLVGQPMFQALLKQRSPLAAGLIALEYTRTLVGVGLFIAAATTAGARVETDRRSTDFLKLRFGNLRIDPLAGVQQIGVFLSRLQSGTTKTAKGKIVPIKGQVPFGKTTAVDVMQRFLRTKLNPPIGAIVSGIRGADPTGRATSWINEAIKLGVPLGPSDVVDALKINGVPEKLAAGLAAVGGMGVSQYKPETKEATTRAYRLLRARDQAIVHGDIRRAIELTIKLEK